MPDIRAQVVPKDTMTSMMPAGGSGSPSTALRTTPRPSGLRERTRLGWKLVKPYWNKTTWWTMLAVAILMVLWEVDDLWSGTIYGWLGWARENVLKQFPIFPFILGILARHYILRDDSRLKTPDDR